MEEGGAAAVKDEGAAAVKEEGAPAGEEVCVASAAITPDRPADVSHHARVLEGVAKSQFGHMAVVFKSGEPYRGTVLRTLPARTLWRGTILSHTKCFWNHLAKVNSHPNPSTYFLYY